MKFKICLPMNAKPGPWEATCETGNYGGGTKLDDVQFDIENLPKIYLPTAHEP